MTHMIGNSQLLTYYKDDVGHERKLAQLENFNSFHQSHTFKGKKSLCSF
jgi:hypothetical protein